jgi:hypothetical protein
VACTAKRARSVTRPLTLIEQSCPPRQLFRHGDAGAAVDVYRAKLRLRRRRPREGSPDSLGYNLEGFRHRYRTDAEPEKTLWVSGACELETMHALLAQLRQAKADLAAAESAHHPAGCSL